MLILERKPGEAINLDLGDGVEIRVKEVKGDQVALALEAPSDVTILREELTRRSTAPGRKLDHSGPDDSSADTANANRAVLRLSPSQSE